MKTWTIKVGEKMDCMEEMKALKAIYEKKIEDEEKDKQSSFRWLMPYLREIVAADDAQKELEEKLEALNEKMESEDE